MIFLKDHKSRSSLLLISAFLMLISLSLWSCGGGGGDDSTPPAPPGPVSSLLSVSQLKAWIDNGYKDGSGNKVVVLDTSFPPNAQSDYNAGHIPGAIFVDYNNELVKTRSDGPITVALMVNDGPQMDALVQRLGIDKNTIVVFTGHHIYWMTRAYWTFRYWGFPQNHLFVLNGKGTTATSVWKAAGYALETTTPPAPARSSFSVSSWKGNMDYVRSPLSEVQLVAQGKIGNSCFLDSRAESEWTATVAPSFSSAYAYRFNNSIWRPWELNLAGTNLGDPYSVISVVGGATGNHVLKTPDQLKTEFTQQGFLGKNLVVDT